MPTSARKPKPASTSTSTLSRPLAHSPARPLAPQAKIYDRDGRALGEFVRGDMYIRDARNTKGHVSGLTCGTWHPTDRYTAMTASEDGTVRGLTAGRVHAEASGMRSWAYTGFSGANGQLTCC